MQIRKLVNTGCSVIIGGLVVLSAMPSVSAFSLEKHYGVRTDTLLPIHTSKNVLWYCNLHTQIPSLNSAPHFWLVNGSTGLRWIPTPYFIFGFYVAGGQLNNQFGRTYIGNPGLEFWFPLAKLSVHAYFMTPQVQSKEKVRPLEESKIVKRAIDIRLSGTFLPFVRPFGGIYYLSTFSKAAAEQNVGSLHFSGGVEWLMTPQCTLEVQNTIGKSNVLIRLKLHSAKVRQLPKNSRIVHYLREPIDQYTFPIMALSPDGPDQAAFWHPESVPPVGSLPSEQPTTPVKPVPPTRTTFATLYPTELSFEDDPSFKQRAASVDSPNRSRKIDTSEQSIQSDNSLGRVWNYVHPITHERIDSNEPYKPYQEPKAKVDFPTIKPFVLSDHVFETPALDLSQKTSVSDENNLFIPERNSPQENPDALAVNSEWKRGQTFVIASSQSPEIKPGNPQTTMPGMQLSSRPPLAYQNSSGGMHRGNTISRGLKRGGGRANYRSTSFESGPTTVDSRIPTALVRSVSESVSTRSVNPIVPRGRGKIPRPTLRDTQDRNSLISPVIPPDPPYPVTPKQ